MTTNHLRRGSHPKSIQLARAVRYFDGFDMGVPARRVGAGYRSSEHEGTPSRST
jgi:hypothetical protein